MALQHKMSDALKITLDKDPITQKPVIIIEFKFVHYRLVIDDQDKAKELIQLIIAALEPDDQKQDRPKLPRFYAKP